MSAAELRPIQGSAAPRPAPRTITAEITTGGFAGWRATMSADFAAGTLADLQSGSAIRILTALEPLIISHNLPDADDQVAKTLAEVTPYDGLLAIVGELIGQLGTLPNR